MQRVRPMLAIAAALAVATGMVPTVLAQDESAGQHPILGSWIVDATPANDQDAPDLISFGLEGSTRGAGPNGPSVGTWQPTGERSADVTGLYFIDDPEGTFLGFATVRGSLEVAEDGQTFSGTYTFEPPAAFAAALGLPEGEFGPGEVTGRRIGVEPMGEPVAPIPEFPLPAPAAPEGGGAVDVALAEFEITMASEIPAGETTFRVSNDGTVQHNFEVEGQGIEEEFEENLRPGQRRRMTLDLAPGTYTVYCPIANHRERGMEVELTVG